MVDIRKIAAKIVDENRDTSQDGNIAVLPYLERVFDRSKSRSSGSSYRPISSQQATAIMTKAFPHRRVRLPGYGNETLVLRVRDYADRKDTEWWIGNEAGQFVLKRMRSA